MQHPANVAPPFSPAEDALVAELRRRHVTFDQIARELGRSSGPAVRVRYAKVCAALADAEHRAHAQRRGKQRNCNRCGDSFWSDHAGVRSCDPCRALAADTSPFEP